MMTMVQRRHLKTSASSHDKTRGTLGMEGSPLLRGRARPASAQQTPSGEPRAVLPPSRTQQGREAAPCVRPKAHWWPRSVQRKDTDGIRLREEK